MWPPTRVSTCSMCRPASRAPRATSTCSATRTSGPRRSTRSRSRATSSPGSSGSHPRAPTTSRHARRTSRIGSTARCTATSSFRSWAARRSPTSTAKASCSSSWTGTNTRVPRSRRGSAAGSSRARRSAARKWRATTRSGTISRRSSGSPASTISSRSPEFRPRRATCSRSSTRCGSGRSRCCCPRTTMIATRCRKSPSGPGPRPSSCPPTRGGRQASPPTSTSSTSGLRNWPAPSAGPAPRPSDREETVSGLQLMIPPFVACMVLVAMLSYLGLHVIAREVIFVDLSLAQMAALGGLTALLVHVAPDSGTAYLFALLATALGAFVFALTRTSGAKGRVPQEAFIGIVYVVASGAAILVANKVPGGGEAIEKTLTGSILWVTWPTIAKLAVAYAALGVFHYMLRHKFLTISFHPQEAERAGWKIRWWDFWFYLSFGIVITLAVPIGGVLMVFSFLVVPAVIAFLFTRDMRRLTYIAWGSGAVASLLGLWISFTGNLPTGPLIVCMYGVLLVAVTLLRRAAGGGAQA